LGYKAGADDYLNKPFDSEVLLMKIKGYYSKKIFDVKAGRFSLNLILGVSLNSRFLSLMVKNL
jgi:DNA-binding response OmpR family regulator